SRRHELGPTLANTTILCRSGQKETNQDRRDAGAPRQIHGNLSPIKTLIPNLFCSCQSASCFLMDEKPITGPSLRPSLPPGSKDTSRVMAGVESPHPHAGWYSRGYLPHWDHPGILQSINFRLGDSMPASVVERWRD